MGPVSKLTLPPRLRGTSLPAPSAHTLPRPPEAPSGRTQPLLRPILTDVKGIEHIAGPFGVIPPAPKEDCVIDEDG